MSSGPLPALSLDFIAATTTIDPRITFSRGSQATLTDATGKLTYAPNNLLTYSEQFDNAAWTKINGGAGSAPVVTANVAVAPDGTTTADRLQTNSGGGAGADYSVLRQSATSTVGIRSIWMKSNTGSDQTVYFGTPLNSTPALVTSTWQRFSYNATTASAFFDVGSYPSAVGSGVAATADILIWGAQLEAVTYQTTPSTYVATTSAAYYGPRLDYDPVTLAAKGLLIEEARTNLLTYSSDFTNVIWNNTNVTVTAAATASPDGRTNASKLAATATAATAFYQTATVAGTSATYSVYVKQGTGPTTFQNFGLRNVTTLTNLLFITFNYSTGAIAYTTGSTGATAANVGNGWWRISLTATSGITSGDTMAGYIGHSGAVATAGDFLYAYGAQLEAGAFATSYIPTVASTATRSADVATMTGSNFSSWYRQDQGTFVVGFTLDKGIPSAQGRVINVDAGAGAGRVVDMYSTTAWVSYNGTTAFSSGVSAVTSASAVKAAAAYASGSYALAINGVAPGTDSSALLNTPTQMNIGRFSGGSNYLNGHIRTLQYYPNRLSNSQLQALTA